MKTIFITVLILLYAGFLHSQTLPKVSSGTIQRLENFSSKFVEARNVDIWFPEGYTPEKKYAVLYMHDGQMLFDASTTWNKQAWDVDEVAAKLILEGRFAPKDTIKVECKGGVMKFDKV